MQRRFLSSGIRDCAHCYQLFRGEFFRATITRGAVYWGADKSLARPGRKQARKHVRYAHDFNNIETQAVIMFVFFLQGKAPNEIHAILTETLACFLHGRAKNLSAPLYYLVRFVHIYSNGDDFLYQKTGNFI